MIIDINIHNRTFAKRLFLSFKYFAGEVFENRLTSVAFIKNWMAVILNLEKYPVYEKEFWMLVKAIPGEHTADMDGIINMFNSINKNIR